MISYNFLWNHKRQLKRNKAESLENEIFKAKTGWNGCFFITVSERRDFWSVFSRFLIGFGPNIFQKYCILR